MFSYSDVLTRFIYSILLHLLIFYNPVRYSTSIVCFHTFIYQYAVIFVLFINRTFPTLRCDLTAAGVRQFTMQTEFFHISAVQESTHLQQYGWSPHGLTLESTLTFIHTYTHIHTYIHTYIHTHIHIHIYITLEH